MIGRGPALTALAIIPDRELAKQFTSAIDQTHAFQILAEFKTYPSYEALEIRVRQAKPEVVLLDVSSNLNVACELIRAITSLDQPPYVIGLHHRNDSEAILRSLRTGGTEFLFAPFDLKSQTGAVTRIRNLLQPEPADNIHPGTIIAFSSAKPGSGASTLAAQTAFALRKSTSKRVLLADFDLAGGMIGFYLKLTHAKSTLDALQYGENMDEAMWAEFVATAEGVDILSAPDNPYSGGVDSNHLRSVLEYARMNYDWVIIDLPVIFQRLSLMTVSESDRAFLVSTSELPSLYLTRKAVNMLDQLGFPKERFQAIINRTTRRDEIAGSDINKLFNCPVYSRIPNDYFSLHRAVTLGHSVDGSGDLGKAMERLAIQLSGSGTAESKKVGATKLKPALVAV